eukprot:Gb_39823 [translate_table: standard]
MKNFARNWSRIAIAFSFASEFLIPGQSNCSFIFSMDNSNKNNNNKQSKVRTGSPTDLKSRVFLDQKLVPKRTKISQCKATINTTTDSPDAYEKLKEDNRKLGVSQVQTRRSSHWFAEDLLSSPVVTRTMETDKKQKQEDYSVEWHVLPALKEVIPGNLRKRLVPTHPGLSPYEAQFGPSGVPAKVQSRRLPSGDGATSPGFRSSAAGTNVPSRCALPFLNQALGEEDSYVSPVTWKSKRGRFSKQVEPVCIPCRKCLREVTMYHAKCTSASVSNVPNNHAMRASVDEGELLQIVLEALKYPCDAFLESLKEGMLKVTGQTSIEVTIFQVVLLQHILGAGAK